MHFVSPNRQQPSQLRIAAIVTGKEQNESIRQASTLASNAGVSSLPLAAKAPNDFRKSNKVQRDKQGLVGERASFLVLTHIRCVPCETNIKNR
jgi:hypothetical protein